MFTAFIFALALATTFCYIECFVTDLIKNNNQYGDTGRTFFFITTFLWGLYHYLIH